MIEHQQKIQQGQCSESGSTLPKHWVNEGPGPPVCAPACTDLLKTTFVSKTADSNFKMDEKNRFYENQQCLDYLGDDKLTSSPEQICKKSSREISNILRTLRLRHCCERNVYSALHDDGMSAVHNGGKACEQILKNLIDADALASRITCGLNEILFRYDCRQVYSIKHGCNDCKVNYFDFKFYSTVSLKLFFFGKRFFFFLHLIRVNVERVINSSGFFRIYWDSSMTNTARSHFSTTIGPMK